jgi:hypothetical protein
VSTTEELLEKQSSGSGLENREYGRRDAPLLLYDTPFSSKSWPTSGGRSVGIVCSRTQATEFVFFFFVCLIRSHGRSCCTRAHSDASHNSVMSVAAPVFVQSNSHFTRFQCTRRFRREQPLCMTRVTFVSSWVQHLRFIVSNYANITIRSRTFCLSVCCRNA